MTVPPQQQTPQQRPAVVTVACVLMFAVVALSVFSAIAGLVVMPGIQEAFAEQAEEQGLDQQTLDIATTTMNLTIWVTVGLSVLISVGYAVLAFFNLRGANWSRITTWVLTGLFLLCGVCGLVWQGAGSFIGGGTPEQEEMNRAMEAAIPAWYNAAELGITIVEVLAYIAIIVLLALPAAHQFFRKPEPEWQPPTGEYPPQP